MATLHCTNSTRLGDRVAKSLVSTLRSHASMRRHPSDFSPITVDPVRARSGSEEAAMSTEPCPVVDPRSLDVIERQGRPSPNITTRRSGRCIFDIFFVLLIKVRVSGQKTAPYPEVVLTAAYILPWCQRLQ